MLSDFTIAMTNKPVYDKGDLQTVSADLLYIFQNEVTEIVTEAVKSPSLETGGELFGYYTHTGSPVVQYVLGPGPGARQGHRSFHQDPNFLQREAQRLNDAYLLQHVGS